MAASNAHLHELAEVIGPRPAATDSEARAADYIETVFRARGLETERQEFATPRTYTWSMVAYHLLTIAAAVATGLPILRWPAVAVALAAAVLMWLELDTRWGLIELMPKGPSQNVIGRYVPKARRGERVRKVVVVAHYDSARASLAFSPAMVKNFAVTFGLMKAITFGMPVMIAASAVPWTKAAQPWLWYATLAYGSYLLVPLVINIHRELFMRPVDGANDNASGVAAMLGVMERLVPEVEDYQAMHAGPAPAGVEWAEDLVSEDTGFAYPTADTPAPSREHAFGGDRDWGDVDSGAEPSPYARLAEDEGDEPIDWGASSPSAGPEPAPETGGEKASITDWLGVGGGFDARKKGREIGSWDNFEGEGDEDSGWKGGSVPFDAIDDPEFAATEASRIRRRVTERGDREMAEKEVWFVATGAEEVGTRGMRAFISDYAEDLEDAIVINIDNVGSGSVHWVTAEGMARRYQSDRRLQSASRRVATENSLPVRARVYKGLSTDATPALARGMRAMSVMAFDINGRLPNWHWKTDTAENCSDEPIETAVDFVSKLIASL